MPCFQRSQRDAMPLSSPPAWSHRQLAGCQRGCGRGQVGRMRVGRWEWGHPSNFLPSVLYDQIIGKKNYTTVYYNNWASTIYSLSRKLRVFSSGLWNPLQMSPLHDIMNAGSGLQLYIMLNIPNIHVFSTSWHQLGGSHASSMKLGPELVRKFTEHGNSESLCSAPRRKK